MWRLILLLAFCGAVLGCSKEPPKPSTIGMAETIPASRGLPVGAAALTLTNCTTEDLTVTAEEWEFFDIVNAYRAQVGVDEFNRPISQVIMSQNLNRAATWTSTDLGTRADHVFSHIDSLGRDPAVRRTDCGNPTPGYGEILAGGYSSPQAAFDAFKASPGHNANMLIWDAVQVGVAKYYASGAQYSTYWAMESSWADDGTRVVRGSDVPSPTPSIVTLVPPTVTKTPTPIATVKPTSTPKPTATPLKKICQGRWGTKIEKDYGNLTEPDCIGKLTP